ncbi:MAG: cupredoxin domain-containing protein [Candidatus Limnocylindrales bacterium]
MLIASRIGRQSIALLAGVALVLSGCGAAATPAPSWPAGTIVVTARNSTFDTKELHFQSGATTQLVLVNEDSDAHNIDIRTKSGYEGDQLFRFDPIARTSIAVTVGPLAAGTYYFLCDVHPQMRGTIVVD